MPVITLGFAARGYHLDGSARAGEAVVRVWIPYGPVDSAGGQAWQQIQGANAAGKLSPGQSTTYFTTPRPVYEFYDLQKDPSELANLSGKPELASVEAELRQALAEKMIVDFDYLPARRTAQ